MLANERHQKIQKMILNSGAVTVSDLIQQFGVSIETVRRDLLAMERQGILRRVHGGAVAVGGMRTFGTLEDRNKERYDKKRELAENATMFVQEGDYIAIDSGSTGLAFAEALRMKFKQLTVVTYSLAVYQTLSICENYTLILCGGYRIPGEDAFGGSLALDVLDNLRVQKAFVFPSAVSMEHGILDFHHELCLLQKKLLKTSDEIYILADSSKFEQRALIKIDEMRQEYRYVTDSGLSEELKKIYKENGYRIFDGGNGR